MDSTRQDRAPGGDDRRHLAPRIDRVDFDRNALNICLIHFKQSMDIAPNRKPIGEARLIAFNQIVRFRNTSSTFNWQWVDKRTLRLTNPLTIGPLVASSRFLYLSGNLRAARRFRLTPGTRVNRLVEQDWQPPTVVGVDWDDRNSILTLVWSDGVSFEGRSREIIVQDAAGIEYWVNEGSSFDVSPDYKTHKFFMQGPEGGTLLDSRFFYIPAGSFTAFFTSGYYNDEVYSEWNA